MKVAPAFWYRPQSFVQHFLKLVLTPCGWLYGYLVRKKFDLYFPVPMIKPVICVGNLVVGGAGKTPVVMALAELLKDRGHNPHLLTRGYGGMETGPLQVSPARDTAYDVGDEALLLVEKAPTWVSTNRPLGAQVAMDTGATLVIMDDGYQNAVIYKDFSLLVIDGGVGFGNRQVMPAGPLREPIDFGLRRADAIVIVGEDKTSVASYLRPRTAAPILSARLVVDDNNLDLRDKKVFAFAGIGRPLKFRETLETAGAQISGWQEFPDHFPYDEKDLRDIVDAAAREGSLLVTTAKDYVRLPESLRQKVQKFSVHLVWDDPEQIAFLIEQALRKRAV